MLLIIFIGTRYPRLDPRQQCFVGVIPSQTPVYHRKRIVLSRVLLMSVRLISEVARGTFEVLPHTFRVNRLNFRCAVSVVYDSATHN